MDVVHVLLPWETKPKVMTWGDAEALVGQSIGTEQCRGIGATGGG